MNSGSVHHMIEDMDAEDRILFLDEMSAEYKKMADRIKDEIAKLDAKKDAKEIRELSVLCNHCIEMASTIPFGYMDGGKRLVRSLGYRDELLVTRKPVITEPETKVETQKDKVRSLSATVARGVIGESEYRVVKLTIEGMDSVEEASKKIGIAKMTGDTLLRDARTKWRRISSTLQVLNDRVG